MFFTMSCDAISYVIKKLKSEVFSFFGYNITTCFIGRIKMDIIESVKTAEERAEKIRRDATLQVQELITSYEKKGRDDGAKLNESAKHRAEKIINDARREAESEAETILKESAEKNKITEAQGKKKLEAAVIKFVSLIEGVK